MVSGLKPRSRRRSGPSTSEQNPPAAETAPQADAVREQPVDLTAVINQLRTCCLPLGGRVGGAADFDTGIETVVQITDSVTGGLVYPVAVVIPLADDAADNSLTGGGELSQIVTE